ncbi:uncharacterized protein LOC110228835 [Arabidopsis lyrata subsp. lyrata]|uniref:uncharacterized protein LOC110228835 n=1 Tax=Arabidopsis lyrata subsp. lyrata TaxID=81972 RepID=UPI000A29E9C1|nr:uncharacterized protein LOC110228835 [Arabidopsis lyrata subsp. lyrata]|eukprot:XP_020882675.1 uncharacterized protein LOC110228835 [Arabidopsis lyrata subsp. lyrata]
MSRDLSSKKRKISAHTCVFWDVEDFQVPDGHDPDWVYQKIKSAIAKKGYRGIVEIKAYGEKNKIRDEFLLAGTIVVPEGDKCARVYRMMSDVLFWTLDNPSDYPVLVPNVMVISKNILQEEGFLRVLRILQCRGYNILLAGSYYDVASQNELHFVSSLWLWKSLVDGRKPIDQTGSSQSDYNKE